MNLLTLFSFAVFAAETVLSPIPDDGIVFPTPQTMPVVSFGQLLHFSTPVVLGSTIEPTPAPQLHLKNAYTIAVLGDSMVDTLGPDIPHLKDSLQKLYPGVSFTILNYGVGGENIDSGISRLTNDYVYLGEPKPSLISTHPDIVVVESFAYNPFIDPAHELDRHWLALSKIMDILKSSIPEAKIVMASTIAPNASIFGDGVLNWNSTQKQEKVVRINSYLDNMLRFAQSQHLPIANVYHESGGKLEFINPGDHIHYSDSGRELFGQVVADTIKSAKLLE